MRKALVTGGAGFIGAHLVRALVRKGTPLVVLDNMVAGSAVNLARALEISPNRVEAATARQGANGQLTDQCTFILGDIRDPRAMALACEEVEVIYHQAALRSVPRSLVDPGATNEVNVTGTLGLLEAARRAGVRRVVFASSSSVYGDTKVPTREDQFPKPKSPYGASKLAGEAYCAAYAQVFNLSTVSLRYFNVFGPWQDPASEYAAVIPKFIRLAMRGEPVPIHGDGQQARDFTYVDNVVEANLAAAGSDLQAAAVNVGAGGRHTLIDLVESLERILGRRIERIHQPPRPGDVRATEADISLARRSFGYAPRIDFERGLQLTVESLREATAQAT